MGKALQRVRQDTDKAEEKSQKLEGFATTMQQISESFDRILVHTSCSRKLLPEESKPCRVLDVSVQRPQWPITETVLREIFIRTGHVEQTVIVSSSPFTVDALVQYESSYGAIMAWDKFHNRHIYDGCCLMDVQFASIDHIPLLSFLVAKNAPHTTCSTFWQTRPRESSPVLLVTITQEMPLMGEEDIEQVLSVKGIVKLVILCKFPVVKVLVQFVDHLSALVAKLSMGARNRGNVVCKLDVRFSTLEILISKATGVDCVSLVTHNKRFQENKEEEDGGAADSLERAEVAADLLEVKWSANVASNQHKKDNVSKVSGDDESGCDETTKVLLSEKSSDYPGNKIYQEQEFQDKVTQCNGICNKVSGRDTVEALVYGDTSESRRIQLDGFCDKVEESSSHSCGSAIEVCIRAKTLNETTELTSEVISVEETSLLVTKEELDISTVAGQGICAGEEAASSLFGDTQRYAQKVSASSVIGSVQDVESCSISSISGSQNSIPEQEVENTRDQDHIEAVRFVNTDAQEEDELDKLLAELGEAPGAQTAPAPPVEEDKVRTQPDPSSDVGGAVEKDAGEGGAETAAAKKKEKETEKKATAAASEEGKQEETKTETNGKATDEKIPNHVREMQERLARRREFEEKKEAFQMPKPELDMDPATNPHFDARMGIDANKLLRPKRAKKEHVRLEMLVEFPPGKGSNDIYDRSTDSKTLATIEMGVKLDDAVGTTLGRIHDCPLVKLSQANPSIDINATLDYHHQAKSWYELSALKNISHSISTRRLSMDILTTVEAALDDTGGLLLCL